jgi:hypothetical protein
VPAIAAPDYSPLQSHADSSFSHSIIFLRTNLYTADMAHGSEQRQGSGTHSEKSLDSGSMGHLIPINSYASWRATRTFPSSGISLSRAQLSHGP